MTPRASIKLKALEITAGNVQAAKDAARWVMAGIPKDKLDACGCSGKDAAKHAEMLARLSFLRQKFAPIVPQLDGVPPTLTVGRAYFTARFGDAAAELLGIAPLNPDALLSWLAG